MRRRTSTIITAVIVTLYIGFFGLQFRQKLTAAPISKQSTLIKRFDNYKDFETSSYKLVSEGWTIQHLATGAWTFTHPSDLVVIYTKYQP